MKKKEYIIENIENFFTFEPIIGWLLDFVFLLLLLSFHIYLKFDAIKNEYFLILPLFSFLLHTLKCLFLWWTCSEDDRMIVLEYLCCRLVRLQALLFIHYIDSFYNKRTYYLLIPSYIYILFFAFKYYLDFDEISEHGFKSWIDLFIRFFMNVSFTLSITFRMGTIYPFRSIFTFLMHLWILIPISIGIICFLKSSDITFEDKLHILQSHSTSILSMVLHVLFLLKLEDIIGNSFWWIVIIIGTLFILFNDGILTYCQSLLKGFFNIKPQSPLQKQNKIPKAE
jgi:hypothetical protein